jgi:hypothetical protein
MGSSVFVLGLSCEYKMTQMKKVDNGWNSTKIKDAMSATEPKYMAQSIQ